MYTGKLWHVLYACVPVNLSCFSCIVKTTVNAYAYNPRVCWLRRALYVYIYFCIVIALHVPIDVYIATYIAITT